MVGNKALLNESSSVMSGSKLGRGKASSNVESETERKGRGGD